MEAEMRGHSASRTTGDAEHPTRKYLKHENSGENWERGTMPPVIEEGQEPPHPTVLPI